MRGITAAARVGLRDELGETDAWRELSALVERVFSGVESLAPDRRRCRAATNVRYERISEQKPRNRLTKFAVSCIINDWFRDGLHRGNAVRARLSWRLLPLLL